MDKLLKAALKYEAKGWSIIPINTKTKIPLIKWAEYQNIRPTRIQIKKWWTQWPDANIAVITGKISGLVVVDVDIRHGANYEDAIKVAPTNLIAKTGSGGYHLFYEYPPDIDNIPNRVGLWDGIDVRADRGYVLLTPSLHQLGNEYVWQNYGVPASMPLPILDAIVGGGTQNPNAGPGDRPRWITELLDRGCGEGSRNDSCTRLAGYFARQEIPKDTTLAILKNWNHEKNQPPLSQTELETIIDSVYKTKWRRDNSHRRIIVEETNPESAELFNMVRYHDYLKKYSGDKMSWLIEDWLPAATMGFMVAAPGSYKTWLLLDLAVSIASGTDFLGLFKVKEKGPVLIIQQEDWHGQMIQRLNTIVGSKFKIGCNYKDDELNMYYPPDLPIYFHTERKLKFDDLTVMDMLQYRIETIKPKLVIIDPLFSVTSTDDYMVKAAEHLFRLKDWRDQYGCSYMIAHHTRKQPSAKGKQQEDQLAVRDDGWGSTFLNASLETGWQIRTTSEKDKIIIRRHFKNAANSSSIYLKFNINTEISPKIYTVIAEDLTPQQIELIDDTVIEAITAGAVRIVDIIQQTGMSRSKVRRQLRTLEEGKTIVRESNGIYRVVR